MTEPEIVFAWMLPAAIALSAIPGLAGLFKKRPKRPREAGLDPELEQRALGAITRRIGERRGESLKNVRTSAARRGFSRSGQTAALERRVNRAADLDITDAETQFLMRRSDRAGSIAREDYGQRLAEFQSSQEAGGAGLSSALLNFLLLMGGGGGKKAVAKTPPFQLSGHAQALNRLGGAQPRFR